MLGGILSLARQSVASFHLEAPRNRAVAPDGDIELLLPNPGDQEIGKPFTLSVRVRDLRPPAIENESFLNFLDQGVFSPSVQLFKERLSQYSDYQNGAFSFSFTCKYRGEASIEFLTRYKGGDPVRVNSGNFQCTGVENLGSFCGDERLESGEDCAIDKRDVNNLPDFYSCYTDFKIPISQDGLSEVDRTWIKEHVTDKACPSISRNRVGIYRVGYITEMELVEDMGNAFPAPAQS